MSAEDYRHKLAIAKKEAKRDFGPGWQRLGPTFQRALIAERVLHILYAQDDRIPGDAMKDLVYGLIAELVKEFNA